MEDDLSLSTEDVRLLVELGFCAATRGHFGTAAEIFEGVRAARPREEAGFVGAAMAMLAQGRIDAAIATLRDAPPSDYVLTFLGIALGRYGDFRGASELLGSVVRADPESAAARLASQALCEWETTPNGLRP